MQISCFSVEDFKSFVLFALTDVIEISFAIPLS